MLRSDIEKSKSLLNPKIAEKKLQLSRHFPSPELSTFVNYYWIVRWDLRGEDPYVQELIPHPGINLVIEKGNSRVVGVTRKKFSYLLKDKGMVFAVMFLPGGFHPFFTLPIFQLTDKSVSLQEAFGIKSITLEESILGLEEEEKMVEIIEHFFRERLPKHDMKVSLINKIVDRIIVDREILKVDDLVKIFKTNKRTLQRMFNQYVGVSPKWVIKRYRLQDGVERLTKGETDFSKLALDLGYYDQTHFIKDFKDIIGKSPREYKKSLQ